MNFLPSMNIAASSITPSSNDPLPSLDLSLVNPYQGLAQDKLPKSLADFFTENCKGSDQDIVEKGKQLFYSMCLQEEECVAVEKLLEDKDIAMFGTNNGMED